METKHIEESWYSTFTTFGGYCISVYHADAMFKLKCKNTIICNTILNLYHRSHTNIFILFNSFDYKNDTLIIELRAYIKSDIPLPEHIDIHVNGNSKRIPIVYTEDMETNNNIKTLVDNTYKNTMQNEQ